VTTVDDNILILTLRALTQQQAEQIAELVEYAKGLRAALVETDRQLETGFVRCETCGDQEDTATFDCRSWPIADALAKPMPKAMKET
jgi:hypothetical protein